MFEKIYQCQRKDGLWVKMFKTNKGYEVSLGCGIVFVSDREADAYRAYNDAIIGKPIMELGLR